jgi:hypothetical protein
MWGDIMDIPFRGSEDALKGAPEGTERSAEYNWKPFGLRRFGFSSFT